MIFTATGFPPGGSVNKQWQQCTPPGLTLNDSTFCPGRVVFTFHLILKINEDSTSEHNYFTIDCDVFSVS
jgi:hypothetical protein